MLKEFKKEILDEFDLTEREKGRRGEGETRALAKPRPKKPNGFDSADACIDYVVRKRNEQGEPVTTERKHRYTCPETGEVPVVVARLRNGDTGKKSYTQSFRNAEGRYVASKPADFGQTPLYNRKRLIEATNVLVVEGEWAVEAFTRLKMDGWAATTTLGGAGKSEHADLSPLAGKNVWLWADNDDYDEKLKRFPGEHHMQEIATRLLTMEPSVTVKRVRIEELDLKAKDDIVDYLDQFTDGREKVISLKLVFQDAESLGATKGLREQFELIAAGGYEHIQLPGAERLSELSKALYPATVTILCGDPGVAKSFWMIEKFWRLHEAGRKVKVLMLEEDLPYWQRRVLAQMSKCADISDIDWIRGHPEAAMRIFNECEERLDSFSRRIAIAPQRPTYEYCADWVDEACSEGNEVVGIDPITAAVNGEKAWLEDAEFLFRVKESAIRTNARLIFTNHPKLDVKMKPSLAGMAGGAAWPRFAQTVFWLRLLERPQDSHIDPGDGRTFDVTHEREMQIRKSRNGRGAGSNIANILDRSTLCFEEAGEIVNLD